MNSFKDCTCSVDEDACPVCTPNPCPECGRRFGHVDVDDCPGRTVWPPPQYDDDTFDDLQADACYREPYTFVDDDKEVAERWGWWLEQSAVRIEKLDDVGAFEYDNDAWEHVYRWAALNGQQPYTWTCRRALANVRRFNRPHWDEILDHVADVIIGEINDNNNRTV